MSEPAPGSLKPWPQMSSTLRMRGRKRRFCSSVPNSSNIGPSSSKACELTRAGAAARAYSVSKTTS